MYLPTFWKLTAEATMYRTRHMAGYGLPVGFLSKAPSLLLTGISYLDHVSFSLQLGVLLHHSSPQRCPQERQLIQLRTTTFPGVTLPLPPDDLTDLLCHPVPQSDLSFVGKVGRTAARI